MNNGFLGVSEFNYEKVLLLLRRIMYSSNFKLLCIYSVFFKTKLFKLSKNGERIRFEEQMAELFQHVCLSVCGCK